MIAIAQPREKTKDVDAPHNASQTKSVLLLDPYPVSRIGVKVLFSQYFATAEISESSCHQEGASILKTLNPDLLILNLQFKQEHILQLIQAVHQFNPHTLMLGFGDRLNPNRSRTAVRAGLHGLIELHQSHDDLVESIDTLLHGECFFSRVNRARFLEEALFSPDKAADAPLRALSNRERQIFQFIGQGLSIRQMAQSIQRSPKTVETYREHIKHKLNIDSASHLHSIARTWVESGVIPLQTAPSTPHANVR